MESAKKFFLPQEPLDKDLTDAVRLVRDTADEISDLKICGQVLSGGDISKIDFRNVLFRDCCFKECNFTKSSWINAHFNAAASRTAVLKTPIGARF